MASDFHIGTVEVFLESEGGWFEVCDVRWDDKDAKVSIFYLFVYVCVGLY